MTDLYCKTSLSRDRPISRQGVFCKNCFFSLKIIFKRSRAHEVNLCGSFPSQMLIFRLISRALSLIKRHKKSEYGLGYSQKPPGNGTYGKKWGCRKNENPKPHERKVGGQDLNGQMAGPG